MTSSFGTIYLPLTVLFHAISQLANPSHQQITVYQSSTSLADASGGNQFQATVLYTWPKANIFFSWL